MKEKGDDFISKAQDDHEGFRNFRGMVREAKILQKMCSVSLVFLTQNSRRKMNPTVIVYMRMSTARFLCWIDNSSAWIKMYK